MACDRRAVKARELGPGISVFKRMLDIVSIPSNRRFVQVDMHLLGLEVFVDAVDPQFPTETRLLKATPWRFHIRRLHVIDPYDPGTDSLHHAQGAIDVTRPDCGRQPERGVVCDLERLAFILERDDSSDRPKNLFPGNA